MKESNIPYMLKTLTTPNAFVFHFKHSEAVLVGRFTLKTVDKFLRFNC